MINFENLNYLKLGNPRQQKAYQILTGHKIFDILQDFNPILTGTIPIGIDLPESDLDISCYAQNLEIFRKTLENHFSGMLNFSLQETEINNQATVISTFLLEGFELEIFGQNIPSIRQNAYQHLLIEHQVLTLRGTEFKRQIIELKKKGMKTEPAFAKLLHLDGNPYETLLRYQIEKT